MSDGEFNENWFKVLNRKLVVMVDIDDCLMPWAEQVHLKCIEAGLAKPGSTWTQWGMYEDYGCTKEQWLEVVNAQVVHGGIYHSPPYPGAIEALRKLEAAGAEIHLVTARGFFAFAEEIRGWTHDWVETFNVPGQLSFFHHKEVKAREIGATHAIDDGIHNAIALLNEGVDVYLMNQPHNLAEEFDPYRRVDSVSEFVERILNG